MKKFLVGAVVILVIGVTANFASANLLADPGFEFWDDYTTLTYWTEYDTVPAVTLDNVQQIPSPYARTGTYAAVMSDAGLGYNQNVGVVSQFNITETGTYAFGAYFTFVSAVDPGDISGWPDERYGVTAELYLAGGNDYPNLIYSVPSNLPGLGWSYDDGEDLWISDWYLIDFTACVDSLGVGKLNLYLQNYDTETASWAVVDDAYAQPVPEPATMLLLGSGLLGLAGFRRRFRKG